MNQTLNITKTELITLLNEVKSSTFVNLVTETKVRMNKTNNPYYDKVVKNSKCNFLMGNNYEDRTDTNYIKEGLTPNFQVEEMTGRRHISKVVCVDTKTESKHYLCVERFDEIKPSVEYTYEGNPIDKQLFESYMVKVSESKKQECERKVKWLTYGIDSIKEITFGGTKYIIER